MRRRLFNALCLLSLMLAIALAALWVRSLWYIDAISTGLPGGDLTLTIRSERGALWFELDNSGNPGRGVSYQRRPFINRQALKNLFWTPEFESQSATWRGIAWKYRAFILPQWIPLLGCLLAPTAWPFSRRRRRARLARSGHCVACGYDLHGSIGPTCPECGAAAAKPPLLSSAP